MDYTPPPLFKQGTSAVARLVFYVTIALALLIVDARFDALRAVRQVAATVLNPFERSLRMPVDGLNGASDYLMGLQRALSSETAARSQLARQAERASRVEQLQAENNRLRALLELRPALTVRSQPAEVLYDAPDPYSRKVILDRGSTQGIALASPVIDEAGVLGQVTRVYPLSSEVTLLTDKEAAIPVLNTRSQARSAAFGTAIGSGLELRFMAGNADVQVGDVLHTSGVDGIYPPGLAVAKVTAVDRKVDTGFARIALAPVASADGVRHVLVLDPIGLQMPPKPEAAPTAPERKPAAPKKPPPRKNGGPA